MRSAVAASFAIAFAFLAYGCSASAAVPSKCSSGVPPMTQRRVVQAQNDLGFSLLHAVSGKDAFISPFSIAQALGVVYLGARGATAKAFVKSSVVPPVDPSDFACASQNLRAGLPRTDADLALEFANALWVRQGLSLKTSFVAKANAAFGADVTSLDFGSPDALRTINAWVNQRTKGHIPTILNSLGDAEAIVTNAVYFKALWEEAFTPALTSPGNFMGATATTSVPFMNQTETFSYYAGSGYELVRLGYRGDRFAMYVVLPRQGTGLAMESTLGPAFATALAYATPRRVNLHLPKLHLAYETDLVSPLTNIGLGVAFSDGADFSGISDTSLKISGVIHKTTLDVDEAGTTATAATAVVMTATARYDPIVPIVVKVDHPFFCIIRDDKTGAVLFLGAIGDVPG
ncbi:MAG: serpin family protein [Candidatus Cybelea sp.]